MILKLGREVGLIDRSSIWDETIAQTDTLAKLRKCFRNVMLKHMFAIHSTRNSQIFCASISTKDDVMYRPF